MRQPIGGNPPLAETLLSRARGRGRVRWVTSGRDGYLLVRQSVRLQRWLLPDYLCAVVPRLLRADGALLEAYRPGRLGDVPLHRRRRSVVVLLWDVDKPPAPQDMSAAEESSLVVEDRCLWAGLPWHLGTLSLGHVAIGSCRKWLGLGDGGWVVSRGPGVGTPDAPPDDAQVAAVVAAAALRRMRLVSDDARLEVANVVCSELAENGLGAPQRPRAISRLGWAMLSASGRHDGERTQRSRLAGQIAALVGPSGRVRPGAIGVRVAAERRDELRAALARARVYAPTHWRDGAWSGSREARKVAATTLTVPAPAGLSAGEIADYLGLLARVLPKYRATAITLAGEER